MLKIAVLVSGGGTNLQAIIDNIQNNMIQNVTVEVVISNNRNAYALERAKNNNIKSQCISPKSYENRDIFNEALVEEINKYNIDLIVLAGYLVKLPEKLIEQYENRIINIHPSLIPSFCGVGYYGLKVHEAALERGVKITGATVHFVDKNMDTGPIIMQKSVAVKQEDTPEILQRRVMEQAEWVILPKTINLIAQNKIKVVQNKVIEI